jgi:hypothetical protein
MNTFGLRVSIATGEPGGYEFVESIELALVDDNLILALDSDLVLTVDDDNLTIEIGDL